MQNHIPKSKYRDGRQRANTACSGQQGVAAFFGSFQHLSRIPFSSLVHARPAATNAGRWGAKEQSSEAFLFMENDFVNLPNS
jgi:hypothetical protein